MGSDDGHRIDRDHPLAAIEDVNVICFGDLDHDGRVDAFLGRDGADMLWLRDEEGGWTDATASAGVAGEDHRTVDGLMVDADHDGDLDLIAIVADGPDRLWNNDRDGGFRDIAPEAGIGGGEGSRRVLAADLDGTRDLDLFILRDQPPHLVHLNDRLWSYTHDDPRFDALREADILLATSGDLDGDGAMDLVTADSDGGIFRWSSEDAGPWTATALETLDTSPSNLVVMDQDGDGGLEVVVDRTLGLDAAAIWQPFLDDSSAGYSAIALPRDGAAEPIEIEIPVRDAEEERVWAVVLEAAHQAVDVGVVECDFLPAHPFAELVLAVVGHGPFFVPQGVTDFGAGGGLFFVLLFFGRLKRHGSGKYK